MDNQQVTLTAYISGLVDGEGSFYLYRIHYKKDYQYRAYAGFTNCDPAIIQKYIDFLRHHKINYHVGTDIRKNGHKVCYNVLITSQESRIRYIELLEPFLTGDKAIHAQMVKEFLLLRRKIQQENIRELDERGKSRRPGTAGHTPELVEIYERYKKLKGSSETTRKAPVIFLRQDEDIVRQPTKVD